MQAFLVQKSNQVKAEFAAVAIAANAATAKAQNQAPGAAASSSRGPFRGGRAHAIHFLAALHFRLSSKPTVHWPCISSKLGSTLCTAFGADLLAHLADQHLRQGTEGLNGGYSVVGITHAANPSYRLNPHTRTPVLSLLSAKRNGNLGGCGDRPPPPKGLARRPPPRPWCFHRQHTLCNSMRIRRLQLVFTFNHETPLTQRLILPLVLLFPPLPLLTPPLADMLSLGQWAPLLSPSHPPSRRGSLFFTSLYIIPASSSIPPLMSAVPEGDPRPQ